MKEKPATLDASLTFSVRCWMRSVSPCLRSIVPIASAIFAVLLSLLATLFPAAGAQGDTAAAPPRQSDVDFREITVLTIHAKHMGWGVVETNLTLIRSNGLFVGADHGVPEAAVSNLLAVMGLPPREKMDPANPGLTPEWLETNRDRVLTAFGGTRNDAIFPLASPRQRAWLTNALLDLDFLGEVIRSSVNTHWTDDYPEIHLGFSRGDTEVARVESWAQHTFMVPWAVIWGTNRHTTYDAEISRAVANLLPNGFLHRKRIQGDLFTLLTGRLENHPKLQAEIGRMVLEESLEADASRFLCEFELTHCRVWGGGSSDGFPSTWVAVLHRTNWPARLQMPVQTRVEQGVVPLLRRLLDSADARVQPVLRNRWLVSLVQGEERYTIEVSPEGSPADDGIMRGHVAKVGLGGFHDEHQSLMQRGLFFTLRDNTGRSTRTSGWFVLPDGRLLLVRFEGDGVLGWTPQELGFRGLEKHLRDYSYNMVGVFVTSNGQIEKVVPQTGTR